MHSAFTFATLFLAASSATASPIAQRGGVDKTVRVILQDQSTELGTQTTFFNVNQRRVKKPAGSTGPYQTFELAVGPDAQQNLRCQALDRAGNALVATRGANTDTTFSDADKGPWTFVTKSVVDKIVCDPSFKAAPQSAAPPAPSSTTPPAASSTAPSATPTAAPPASGADKEVRIILSSQSSETGSQTTFENFVGRAQLPTTGTTGPFETVEIVVGAAVTPTLRCQMLDRNGVALFAARGGKNDTTFSDADKGPWKFARLSEVNNIVCDPAFVANPQ